ncbi:uncharacterized protein [Aristolochia californica]|uniref:uncharacterized protein isoform X2 n=1 Tax=Aristolochia californica TaxID=171875 RepID=UPI0035DA0428
MATISSPRPLTAPGSGGKIRRARHLPPATSPYLRPAPATSPDSPNRGWLFTAARSVTSTAGKLLSVFLSENSSSSSRSSGTSSSSDGNGENYECEDVNCLCCVCSKMTVDLNTNGNLPVATMNPDKELQSITQDRSRTKLAIEFLLLQETYTREECIKLTKIIQSRVVDGPSNGPITKEGKDAVLKGLYSQSVGNATPPSETWVPLSQMRKSPHVFPYSANRRSIFSPKSSVFRACSPDVQKTAIMEAKKWLQEKKSEMSSKSDLDHGPCNLNTDMLSYGNGGDMSSPVDLAKSYMQRPPWASPSLLNITFKSPSPVRLQFPDDEIHHAMSSQPSLEDLGDACLSQQKVGSGTASHESTVPTAVPTQNIGGTVGELTSNREVLVSQEIWCSMPSSEMRSAAEKVVHDAFEPHQPSCFPDASSFSDLKLQQAYDQIQNGSNNITGAGESSSSRSSLLVGLNAKSGGKSLKKSKKQSSLSREVADVASSRQVRKLRGEASMEVPPDDKNNDIEVGSRTRNHPNAFNGHANGNRRKEVGYKRRREKGK